ncbi:hypothetical protein TI04_00365, partial [Achromatium sp. WMS2]
VIAAASEINQANQKMQVRVATTMENALVDLKKHNATTAEDVKGMINQISKIISSAIQNMQQQADISGKVLESNIKTLVSIIVELHASGVDVTKKVNATNEELKNLTANTTQILNDYILEHQQAKQIYAQFRAIATELRTSAEEINASGKQTSAGFTTILNGFNKLYQQTRQVIDEYAQELRLKPRRGWLGRIFGQRNKK